MLKPKLIQLKIYLQKHWKNEQIQTMDKQDILNLIVGINQMLTSELVKILDIKNDNIQTQTGNLELNEIMNESKLIL